MGPVLQRDTPQAWARWMRYRVYRDTEARRGVFWPDNLPLYPYGFCPAMEVF